MINLYEVFENDAPLTSEICLPQYDAEQEVNYHKSSYTAGWGYTKDPARIINPKNKKRPDQLLEVEIEQVNHKQCFKWYQKYEIEINRNEHLCYGRGGKDACRGDSGGPLFYQNIAGRYVQRGIVSFGQGCGRNHRPGVYTNLWHYKEWIKTTINRYDFSADFTAECIRPKMNIL